MLLFQLPGQDLELETQYNVECACWGSYVFLGKTKNLGFLNCIELLQKSREVVEVQCVNYYTNVCDYHCRVMFQKLFDGWFFETPNEFSIVTMLQMEALFPVCNIDECQIADHKWACWSPRQVFFAPENMLTFPWVSGFRVSLEKTKDLVMPGPTFPPGASVLMLKSSLYHSPGTCRGLHTCFCHHQALPAL